MTQQFTTYSFRGQPVGRLAWPVCFVLCLVLQATAGGAPLPAIHVYADGTGAYVGVPGLRQALTDVADPGTIYLHSGAYDLGNASASFLTVAKGLTLTGIDDGTGKPVIKGARPSGSAGVIYVNAPEKAIVFDNVEIVYYGTRPTGTIGAAVYVQGSKSFTVQHCTITAASFDGSLNRGIYGAMAIEGLAQSEFPTSPNYSSRFNVKGEVIVRDSTLTAWVSDLIIGVFGPVSLDRVEVTNCTLNSLGVTQFGNWNRGDLGIGVAQYPLYLTDANQATLIPATHAGTQTVIRNNDIRASRPVALAYLKGTQRIERNRVHSLGSWFWTGGVNKYQQWGILAFGYPYNQTDASTFSEVIIRRNVIELQVPAFPIPGAASFSPPQTASNTHPVAAIWVGAKGKVLYSQSTIAGHPARETVSGNIISTLPSPQAGQPNLPDFGLYLRHEIRDGNFTDNVLGGGVYVDPIDGEYRQYSAFSAKVAQVYLSPEAHDNYFGPTRSARDAEAEPAAAEGAGQAAKYQPNTFGPAGVAGVLCYGQHNQFRSNHFSGDYWGFDLGGGAGLVWLTADTHDNHLADTILNGSWNGFDLCDQVYDETDYGTTKYNGRNRISGLWDYRPKSADCIQRMQALKAAIEARLESF